MRNDALSGLASQGAYAYSVRHEVKFMPHAKDRSDRQVSKLAFTEAYKPERFHGLAF